MVVSAELPVELEPQVAAAEQPAVAARAVVEAGALQLQLRLLFQRQALPLALVQQTLHRHQALPLPC